MPWLYILYSKKLDRYYVGSTPHIEQRINEHNKGVTPSTSTGRPWICVFTHDTKDLIDARRLEYRIKKWKSRKIIERIISEQKLNTG